MKRYSIYGLLLVVTIGLTPSCDKMLDLKPETEASDAVMWETAGAFERAVNQAYTWLPRLQNQGTPVTIYGLLDLEENADLALVSNPISSSTYGLNETDPFYEDYFKRIRAINYVFRNAESYHTPSQIAQYLAEAHFFRAYYSYLVFSNYGPLTIVKKPLDVTAPELMAPRASRDEFADFIISDLEAAINSQALPLQSAIAGGASNGRIALGAAQALLARVCLFEGTWQKYHFNNTTRANALLEKAATYANLVMQDASYQLFYHSALGVNSYRYMFILESKAKGNPAGVQKDANKEYIFRNRFHEDIRQSNQNTVHRSKQAVIGRKALEMFLDIHGNATRPDYKTSLASYLANRDPRLATLSTPLGGLFWMYAAGSTFARDLADSSKMMVMDVTSPFNPGVFYTKFASERAMAATADGFDVPLLRLAEVYLIYAEAKCELGGGVLTQADLDASINKLRTRAHMPHLSAATVPNGSTMLEEIRRERTVELLMEGYRLEDLKRWKTAKDEMSKDLEGLYVGAGSAFVRDTTIVYTRFTPEKKYVHKASNFKNYPNKSTDGYAIRELASKRVFQDKNYLFPLPTKQLILNPNLKQNYGWDE